MTAFETELLALLREFFKVVECQNSPDPARRPPLRPLMDHLDAILERAPPGLNPELRHYLERKSYEKARVFLEERV